MNTGSTEIEFLTAVGKARQQRNVRGAQHISNEAGTIHMNLNVRQTVQERRALGKSLRKQVPRTSHAQWTAGSARPDPIGLLEEQNKKRLDWLAPVRRGRMMASPFSFYRAAARIMAADLAATPVTGLMVQACGDAHLSNFGLFASPERALVFDLNDFDETLEGPWEWDLKRLAASFAIAARHNKLDRDDSRKATGRVAQSYREAMNDFAGMRTTDIWYALLNEIDFVAFTESKHTEKRAKKTIAKAKRKHSRQALDRLTQKVDGKYCIKSEPPLLVPLRDLPLDLVKAEELIRECYEAYIRSVSSDCRVLLKNFKLVDYGLKVVGVGSVGTRCWIVLLEGRDGNDPLFLQVKEATDSVLAEYLRPSPYESHGRRVVEGQRLMQTANDIFLGWTHTHETGHDFYWRQLRDWKGSVDIEGLKATDLNSYARACAWTLARAHARSGDRVAIAGYLGASDTFDHALTEFAERYADQNERDYEVFLEEIRSGRLEAAPESAKLWQAHILPATEAAGLAS
jgi:uncharacterized protein (DUF2252 family)